jgi:hypothetical protein
MKEKPMKSQETVLKAEVSNTERRAAKWSGLQARMTISYVLVTLISAFVLEILHYILYLFVPLPAFRYVLKHTQLLHLPD